MVQNFLKNLQQKKKEISDEYSPESFHGTEVDYAVEVCNAVLDVWQPTADAKAIINIPSTVENAMPHVFASQVEYVHKNGKLPVVNFAAGGVATPADAALMMQLGAEGVFVGSGIFKSGNPAKRANAIVKAVTNYTDAKMIAELSEDLGEAMVGINESEIQLLMAERGK